MYIDTGNNKNHISLGYLLDLPIAAFSARSGSRDCHGSVSRWLGPKCRTELRRRQETMEYSIQDFTELKA